MTVDLFQEKIARGEPLVGEEMIEFMREQSDLSRRILFELNGRYHTPKKFVSYSRKLSDGRSIRASDCFLRFILISVKIYISVKMFLSMPLVCFKTKVEST